METGRLKGWVVPGLDHPGLRILLLAKAMERLNARRIAKITKLTTSEWRVLSRLAPQKEGATVRELAELTWADRAEISRSAAALEEKGFVSRKANPRDGRAPILFCTAAGKKEHARVIPFRTRFYESLVADLTDEELFMLEKSLLKISLKLSSMSDIE